MAVVQSTQKVDLRKQLLIHGVQSLSDLELLAVFISCGNKSKSCHQLAFELVQECGDLRGVINTDLKRFKQIAGLGEVRFVQMQAVKEICRRSDLIYLQKNIQLKNTQQTYAFLKKRLRDYKNETFAALFLDNQNRVITYDELFKGTINSATVYIRPIVERSLQLNAAAIILAHNHPSGVPDASQQDLELTKRIQKALDLIDVRLLDHLVIGDNEVYSIFGEFKTCVLR